MINHPMNNDRASQNNVTEAPLGGLLKPLTDCKLPIGEEFLGTIEQLKALEQKERDSLAWNGPEFVPLPLRFPKT